MVLVNQIPEFLNQSFLQNKMMKQRNSMHVDTNSQKSKVDWKFLVGHGQIWVQPIGPLDYKIDCVCKINRWS